MSRRTSSVAVAALAALTLAACSSDGTASTETTASSTSAAPDTTAAATSTTVDVAALATAYAEPGPYPVGVITLQLAKGPKVEVWYPAVAGSGGTETYDSKDFVPPAIAAILTGDVDTTHSYPGTRDAAVADGTFPVVLFSHGFSGFRLQSTFLTGHLASHGMIVVAPDHPSRSLSGVLGGTATGDRADSVDDLLQSLDLIVAAGADAASPFSGHVDADHVAAVGHSAGGGTVLGAAADDRIDGYVSMASGVLLGRAAEGSTTTAVDPATLPQKPSFFLAGALDQVASVDTLTKPSFDIVPSPSLLWVIDGVGHNGFDDLCTYGGGSGIIGVAEASGLGALLEAQPQLKRLGQDGCLPPALDVTTTYPIINHAVTAWLRNLFGLDAGPVGLDASVSGEYSTPVNIEQK